MAQELPKHRAREYETIFIVNPESTSDQLDQISGRLTEVISRLEGKLLRAENWGKRRLAFPVAKQTKGTYIYLHYLGYADMVHEVERNMRMIEPVIKYMTVKIEEDVNPEARPVHEEDISFAPLFEEEVAEDRGAKEHAPSKVEASSDEDQNEDEESSDDEDEEKASPKEDDSDEDEEKASPKEDDSDEAEDTDKD